MCCFILLDVKAIAEPIALLPTANPEEVQLEAVAWAFKALSDEARLKILSYLARNDVGKCCGPEDGICACDLEAVTGLSQPTVSHHMKCLVSANLVTAEKRGKWMYYGLNPKGFALVKGFVSILEG